MKRGLSLAAAGILAGTFAFAGVGYAQEAPSEHPQVEVTSVGAPTTDLPMAEYNAFDQFSSDHPEIVRQLARNPQLIRSRSFQSKNPALRELFDNHPKLQTAMEQNPGDFLPLAPGAGMHHHHMQRHHETVKSKSAASHSESSSASESSGAAGTAGSATAAPGEEPSGAATSPAGGGNGAAEPGAGSGGTGTSNGAGGGSSGETSGGSGSM